MKTSRSSPRSSRERRALYVAAAVGAAAIVVVAAGLTVRWAGLTWNHTNSLPVGIYARHRLREPVQRGQIVGVQPPLNVQDLVRARGYLRSDEQLLKKVVGMPGDRVCIRGGRYEVNGAVLGPVLTADRVGRPLPSFAFCGAVAPDSYWLGTTSARSFDSRYFGPVHGRDLRNVLVPIWTF